MTSNESHSPSPSEPKARKLGSWAGRVGWFFTVMIAALILAETMARTLLPATEAPLVKEFRVNTKRDRVPFMMFGAPPYNGPTPTMPKPAGEYRVVVLGGSTVEHGDPAIPECLEEQLRKQGAENLRVFNYGVVSANSGNQLARLVFEVVDLQPDLVVFYDGVNDVQHPMVHDPRPGYSFDHVVYEKHPLISESASEYPVIPLMLYGSELMRRCCHEYFVSALTEMKDYRQAVGYRSEQWRREIAKNYVGNAIKARKIAEAHGSKFIWFYQPLVNYKEPRTEKEEEMAYQMKHFTESRKLIRREMAAAIERGDMSAATAIDLSDVFDGVEKQVFWNNTHILQFARWIVVAGMEAPILNLIKDDPALIIKGSGKAVP